MKSSTNISEIRAVAARSQPSGLRIRHCAEFTDVPSTDGRLLSLNETDLESSILGLYDNFMLVKPIESLRGVLASCAHSVSYAGIKTTLVSVAYRHRHLGELKHLQDGRL